MFQLASKTDIVVLALRYIICDSYIRTMSMYVSQYRLQLFCYKLADYKVFCFTIVKMYVPDYSICHYFKIEITHAQG